MSTPKYGHLIDLHDPRIVLYGDNREFMTLSAKPSSEVHVDIDADDFIKANS